MGRILGIVEQLMQMHIKALKDLGVDLEAEAKKAAKKKPLEAKLK
jgi:biotin operon repressor